MNTMGRLLLALVIGVMLAVPAQAASVGGAKINYTSAGTGKTIVFVHGWTCDVSSWDAQVPEFSKSYRVIALDLPGHGKTAAPADGKFSMTLFAEAIEAVRAEVGADKIVLIGHSMGAPVIRQYALLHPEHVAGLVAVDGPLDMRAFPPEVAKQLPDVSGPNGMAARKTLISSMFQPTTSPAVREHVMAMMTSAPEITAVRAQAAMFDPALQTADIIRAPAYSIYAGGGFFQVDPKTTERLPRWEGIKLAGTGHFVMMEKPAEFNALLKDFLEKRAEF
jgi:pimeloyl-ACP methyl ester carboxylesterase